MRSRIESHLRRLMADRDRARAFAADLADRKREADRAVQQLDGAILLARELLEHGEEVESPSFPSCETSTPG